MMFIPKWFERELSHIDPRYFIAWNSEYNYFEIRHRVKYAVVDDVSHIIQREETPTLAVFQHLNDAALENLRMRKRMGERFARADQKHGTQAYLNWIKRSNQEAKAKARQIGAEMVAEGFMRIHNLDRMKMYDMGSRA